MGQRMDRSSVDKLRWNGFVREKCGGWRKANSSGGTRDGSSCSIIGRPQLSSIRGIPPTQFVNMYTLGVAELAS